MALLSLLCGPRLAVAQECSSWTGSSFWLQLEALCRAAETPADIEGYCGGGEAPAWAGETEAERLKRVALLAGEAGVDLATVIAPVITAEANRLIPEPPSGQLATGAGVDALLSELHEWLCAQDETQPWLGATCAEPLGEGALGALRTRALRDLGLLPARALTELTKGESRKVARVLQATIQALLGDARPIALAQALADMGGGGATACVPSIPPPAAGRIEQLAALITRITLDLPRLDRLPASHWERLLTTEIARLGLPPRPAPEIAILAADLSAVAASLRPLEVEAPPPELRRVHARALVGLLRIAWTAVGGVALPATLDEAFAGLVEVDLSAALPMLSAVALELTEVPLPEVAIERLDLVVRVLSAPDFDAQKRIVRNALLGLGRWADGFLLDVNADTPILEAEGFRVGGDLLVGYNFADAGFSVKGGLNFYEFIGAQAFDDGYRAGGELAAWWSPRISEAVKLEGRFEGQGYYYDSTTVAVSLGDTALTDESSLMIRALLDLGVRVNAGSTFAFGLWAGGGLQVELYDAIRLANAAALVTQDTQVGGVFQSRLRTEWLAIPRYLAFRLRSDLTIHSITRDSLAITVMGGDVVPSELSRRSLQLEHYGRLFIDAEIARFAGFVPGLHAGLDTLFRDDESGAIVSNIPVFGVGVRRIAF